MYISNTQNKLRKGGAVVGSGERALITCTIGHRERGPAR